jgi:hypothetical protein
MWIVSKVRWFEVFTMGEVNTAIQSRPQARAVKCDFLAVSRQSV